MTARHPDTRPCGRRDAFVGAGLLVATLVLLVGVSRATGPSFHELARLGAIDRTQRVVMQLAHGSRDDFGVHLRAAVENADGLPTVLALLGAWSSLSVGRVGLLDPITSARLPWLVLFATAPALLFVLVRVSRPRWVALLSGALLAALPAFLHSAVTTRPALLTALTWLAIITASAVSRGFPARRRWIGWILVALATAVGTGLTVAALWALAIVAMHHVIAEHRSTRRLARSAELTLPSEVIIGAVAAPIGWYAFGPERWSLATVPLLRAVLAPLAPSIAPTWFCGRLVNAAPLPAGFAPVWLTCTVPLATSIAAVVGVSVLAHAALARRFASGTLRPRRDRAALGSWVLLGIGATVLGPIFAIAPFDVFPPRVETALPFVAVAAALGAVFLGERIFGPRRCAVVGWTIVAVTLTFALRDPSTLSAAYDGPISPQAIQSEELLPLGDGSELIRLVSASGPMRNVRVRSSDVPPDYWTTLRGAGVRLNVEPSSSAAVVLVRGPDRRPAIARVERDGAVLWSLVAANAATSGESD